jgi:hypothetical protein
MIEYLTAFLSPKEHKRIFSKILIDNKTGCWNWTGSLDFQGYGLLWYKNRTERSHRVLYAFFIKPIPRGSKITKTFQLDHVCKNKRCCNPKHLEIVNQRTNIIRGGGPSAINYRKIYCKHGHELPKINKIGRRDCKMCDSIRKKERMTGPKREYWLNKAKESSRRYYHKKGLS